MEGPPHARASARLARAPTGSWLSCCSHSSSSRGGAPKRLASFFCVWPLNLLFQPIQFSSRRRGPQGASSASRRRNGDTRDTLKATAAAAATAAATIAAAAASAKKMDARVSNWRLTISRTVTSSRSGAPPIVHGGPPVVSAAAACLLPLLLWGAPLGILGAFTGGPYAGLATAESAGAPYDSGPSRVSSLRASLLLGGPSKEQELAPWGRLLSVPVAAVFGLRDSEDEDGSLGLPVSLQTLISVSFACSVGCLVSFFFLSASHLRNYYEPKLQRMVCRIGCALPLFALLSTAACFSVFSELRALQRGPSPYEALSLNHPGPPYPSPALGSSPPPSSVPVQSPTATAPAIPTAAAAAEGAEGGFEGASGGGPSAETVESPWLEGAPIRELAAPDVLLGVPLFSLSTRAPPALPVSPGGPPDGLKGLGGPPFNASGGGPLRDQDHHSPHRRPYYLQQQLFFELGKQLTQSTALYSFSSLMVNACGEKALPTQAKNPPF
ncbi:hypothetical protein Emag_002761 [Eimeria magna]